MTLSSTPVPGLFPAGSSLPWEPSPTPCDEAGQIFSLTSSKNEAAVATQKRLQAVVDRLNPAAGKMPRDVQGAK